MKLKKCLKCKGYTFSEECKCGAKTAQAGYKFKEFKDFKQLSE